MSIFHRHRWWTYQILNFDDVYLMFGNPIGKAKIEYCMDCGTIRFVGQDTKEKHGVKDNLWDIIFGG